MSTSQPARTLLALLIAASAHAQTPTRRLEFAEVRTMHSVILNEDRQLQISLPERYDQTKMQYPVLFLLDGSSQILHATASVRYLSAARNRIPEMIIVAIPNTNRNRDLTPGPGATTFEKFLGDELIPWVEQNYRAAPDRILMGHSLGGSFTVHAMLNRPELFSAYVAISAPVWRYENLAAQVREGLPRAKQAGVELHLSAGRNENESIMRGVAALSAAIDSQSPALVKRFTMLDDEDHSSTAMRSLYHALEARYAAWRFPFFETQAELDAAGGLTALESHYERFSKRFGYSAPVPESRIIQVARILVEAGKHADALRIAEKYRDAYPAMAEGIARQVNSDLQRRKTSP